MTDRGRIVQFPDKAAIEAEAAAWVARFDSADVTAEECAKFQEWLNSSAIHREAIAEFGNLWSDFGRLKQLATSVETEREFGSRPSRSVRGLLLRPWLAAAACLALVVASGLIYRNFQERPPLRLSYETAVGAQKNVALPDGTAVTLNTNSRIDVEIAGDRRDVHLRRGEAYFEVVHDEKRPFTVFAGNGAVRDTGTAFDVHLLASAVDVSVAKGNVEIFAAASAPNVSAQMRRLTFVGAGRTVLFGQKVEHSEIMSDTDLNRKLAWRQGVLIYAGEPLVKMLADISRYSDIQIELADPKLRDRPVGGAFRINQINAVFTALEGNFGIHAVWVDARHVRLTSVRTKARSRN